MSTNNRIDILLDESQDLEFKLDVQGASTKNIKTRMIIETGNGFDITIDGRFSVANSATTFHIPILNQSLVPDQYNCVVEAVIEDRHYIKMGEYTVEAQLPVKVTAALVDHTDVNDSPISIRAKLQNPSVTKEHLRIEAERTKAAEAKRQVEEDKLKADKLAELAEAAARKSEAVDNLNKSMNIFKRKQNTDVVSPTHDKTPTNQIEIEDEELGIPMISTEKDPIDEKSQKVSSILNDLGIPVTKGKRKKILFTTKD